MVQADGVQILVAGECIVEMHRPPAGDHENMFYAMRCKARCDVIRDAQRLKPAAVRCATASDGGMIDAALVDHFGELQNPRHSGLSIFVNAMAPSFATGCRSTSPRIISRQEIWPFCSGTAR